MRFRDLNEAQVAELNLRTYPGFPEYVLLDVPGTLPATFRRGASDANLHIPEAEAWQEFIRRHYLPPSNARVLLLHQCSWAKPYDFSATLEPLVTICREFPFVHRVVFSNVGLIPSELQLNPVFCAYDWCPADPDATPELSRQLERQFEDRVRDYVLTHRGQYAMIGVVGSLRGNKTIAAARCARAASLPFFVVPDQAGEDLAKKDVSRLRLFDDIVHHPEILRQLREMLERIRDALGNAGVLRPEGQ